MTYDVKCETRARRAQPWFALRAESPAQEARSAPGTHASAFRAHHRAHAGPQWADTTSRPHKYGGRERERNTENGEV